MLSKSLAAVQAATDVEPAPEAVARLGIAHVPEGRQVFPNLTVRENLVATAANRRREAAPWTLERVFARLPNLRLTEGKEIPDNSLVMGAPGKLAAERILRDLARD